MMIPRGYNASNMIALGIDPGSRRIGYGVVQCDGSAIGFIAAGILDIKKSDDISALEEQKKELMRS